MLIVRFFLRLLRFFAAPFGAFLLLAACSATGDKNFSAPEAALPVMENIALNARNCWFKSGDKAFRSYRLAPELKSYSGRPRVLIVPYNAPDERPLLVIEGRGNPANVTAYGPLMQTGLSQKISRDLLNWSRGSKKCG